MTIKGRVTQVFPTQESQSGFKWQNFIVCYWDGTKQPRPDSILLTLRGQDKIESTNLNEGDEYQITLSHYVREYNGRHYNELKLEQIAPWQEVKPNEVKPTPVAPNTVEQTTAEPTPVETTTETNPDEELPF